MLNNWLFLKLKKIHKFFSLNLVGSPYWLLRHAHGGPWFVDSAPTVFGIPFVTCFFVCNGPYYNEEEAEKILEGVENGEIKMVSSS